MKATKLVLMTLVMVGLAGLASAALVQTNSSNGDFNGFAAASDDLINAGQSTLAGVDFSGGVSFGDPGALNNGDGGDYFGFAWDGGNAVVTANLNTSVNTLGYDITSMTSIASWFSSDRYAQTITVAYSLVGSDDFVTLGTFSNSDNVSTKIVLTDSTGVIASGVDAIRCTLSSMTTFKELDVAGTPTLPEPATMGLLTLGGLGMLIRRKK